MAILYKFIYEYVYIPLAHGDQLKRLFKLMTVLFAIFVASVSSRNYFLISFTWSVCSRQELLIESVGRVTVNFDFGESNGNGDDQNVDEEIEPHEIPQEADRARVNGIRWCQH